MDIARRRLASQHLTTPAFAAAAAVVQSLGAVQAQDYGAAKWALGLRSADGTDASIEREFNDGAFLRTHMLRPTWHFVAPADIRWMLALTAPRVHTANAFSYRKMEIDEATVRKSNATLAAALRDKQLTRDELGRELERKGIRTIDKLRLTYLMMRAELDGIICSGARRGKQFTYALLEERVPRAKALDRDEALAELARRYFTTRGPATARDFSWWSGLTIADAKRGAQSVASELEEEIIDGQTYWFAASKPPRKRTSPVAHLLPNYDEFFIGFRDRSAILDIVKASKQPTDSLGAHVIAIDGQLVGGWRRTVTKNAIIVELSLLTRLTAAEEKAVALAARRYGAFHALPVKIEERILPASGRPRLSSAAPKHSLR